LVIFYIVLTETFLPLREYRIPNKKQIINLLTLIAPLTGQYGGEIGNQDALYIPEIQIGPYSIK
jgi:hypothetical protein